MGPMTGRAAGYCAGYPVPGFTNPVGGRGLRGRQRGFFGRGGGRGYRHWYYATGMPGWARVDYGYPPMAPYMPIAGAAAPTITAEEEIEDLKHQAEYFNESLAQINKRIEQLQAEKKE
jgi:hypothetical protein